MLERKGATAFRTFMKIFFTSMCIVMGQEMTSLLQRIPNKNKSDFTPDRKTAEA
jgi:hypothetical protein